MRCVLFGSGQQSLGYYFSLDDWSRKSNVFVRSATTSAESSVFVLYRSGMKLSSIGCPVSGLIFFEGRLALIRTRDGPIRKIPE